MSPANVLFICYPQGSEQAIKGSGFRVARQRLSHRLTTPTVFYVSNHDWRKERKQNQFGQIWRRVSGSEESVFFRRLTRAAPLLQDAALNCRAVRLID